MFVISMKTSKRKLIIGLLCIIGIVVFCSAFFSSNISTASQLVVQTNQERLDYLQQFGWEVQEEPTAIKEVLIPTEFNDTYETYNIIQKKQGFDLALYKGERVKIWTYTVTNYPDQADAVNANLYVFEDKIIGGDICSTKIDGFMHGFEKE